MLARKGKIGLKQEFQARQGLSGTSGGNLVVVVNDSFRIVYDVKDSPEVDLEDLREADAYFKRSYWDQVVAELGDGASKLFPLGLNYKVITNYFDFYALERALKSKLTQERWKTTAKACLCYPGFSEREKTLSDAPQINAEPRVLFMARAWDPHDDPRRPVERIELRKRINEMRAECIRACRRHFGKRFFGGFAHTAFARKEFPDALLPDASLASKRNYVSLLRKHPICVATSGLHDSIGWKFGEYVAFSKAIVSEQLKAVVPGQFTTGQNYLEFSSVDECLERTERLMSNDNMRAEMMRANHNYYLTSLRPDKLVERTLKEVGAI